jgi:hypothetical protein
MWLARHRHRCGGGRLRSSGARDAHALQDSHLRQTDYLISQLDAVPASPLARERGDADDERVMVRFLQAAGAAAARPGVTRCLPTAQRRLATVMVRDEQWRVFVKSSDRACASPSASRSSRATPPPAPARCVR